jgi:hypothetical protein
MTYSQEMATKAALEALGATVGVRHRQLAHREKTYMDIKCVGSHTDWQRDIMPKIHENFPDAYMTSGGFGVNGMSITIALEK